MEVHHTHAPEKEKHFKHYMFEFLMLFLAISAGFFVENLREHKLEREREDQYMKSMVNDLRSDIINIDSVANKILIESQECDSLILLLSLHDYSDKTASIYYNGRRIPMRWFFYMTDGTIKQLDNAGGMRLIHQIEVVDSINSYVNLYSEIVKLQELKELQLRDFRDASCKVFDVRVFETMFTGAGIISPIGNPKLLSYDLKYLNELMMRAHFVKRNNSFLLEWMERLKIKAINLQALIKKDYHVK